MEQYYRRFGEIVASKKIGKFNDIKAGIKQFLERINVFNSSNETLTGTPSGFREIDDITSG
jgi:replicative DNA helicase